MRRDPAVLATQCFDVLVVGGGIHGAWLALRATEAGYHTALVERDDFGAATSANSLKILHGGLRYLQTLDIPRMRKSVAARREFARLAPGLVEPLACLLPLSPVGLRSPWAFGPALLLNEVISAGQRSGVATGARLPFGHLVGSGRARDAVSALADRVPFGGGIWWDLVLRESDRMTLEVVLAAARRGVVIANRMEALQLRTTGSRAAGVTVRDRLDGREFEIDARMVIDATGPWAGRLAGAPRVVAAAWPQQWVGGLNLVLHRSLGPQCAVALTGEVNGRRRELFFVPWQGVSMVGTHYVPVTEPSALAPRAAISEFLSVLETVAPRAAIRASDIARVHWGVLPCAPGSELDPAGQPVVAIGREQAGAEGYGVVIGEKYTSAPILARTVLSRVQQQLGTGTAQAARESPAAERTERGDTRPPAFRERGAISQRIARGVDVGEVRHAIRKEMALDLADLVERRLGFGELGGPGLETLQAVARAAAPEFGWHDAAALSAARELQHVFDLRRTGVE